MDTKEKLLAALKKRFELFQVGEAILDRFATKLAVSVKDEAQVDAAVNAVTFEQIHQSELDIKLTDANKKAVDKAKATIIAEYEKTYNLKDGKPIPTEEPPTDAPAWFIKYQEGQKKVIEGLQESVRNYQTQQSTESVRAKVEAALAVKKIPKSFISEMAITETDPSKINEIAAAIEAKYNDLLQEQINSNLVFRKPVVPDLGIPDNELKDFLDSEYPIPKE